MSIFRNTLSSYISTSNSSIVNLDAGNSYTFTGTGEMTDHPDMMLNLYADQPTTIQIQFSQDNSNWDSTITKNGKSGFNEFTTIVKGARYVRVIVTTDSLTTTAFRLQTQFGLFRQGNAPVSGIIAQDSDALVVRNIGEEITLAEGKFDGYSIVSKLGKNTDIDTGSVPEDLWDGGGVYTGFPTGSPEVLQAFSSNAGDTGTLYFLYLANNTSEEYQLGSVVLTGTTPVNTGISAWRVHTAWYDNGTSTSFNLGDITLRHTTTTSNVFIFIPIGRSQSNACVYTVPAGNTAYVSAINLVIRGNTSTYVDGALWVRSTGSSPRLRQPFGATNTQKVDRKIDRFPLSAGTDITMRVVVVGSNNTSVVGGMQIRLVKNT